MALQPTTATIKRYYTMSETLAGVLIYIVVLLAILLLVKKKDQL